MDTSKVVIVRYGEIGLKGKNRNLFENRLVSNIRDCLTKNNLDGNITKDRGRIYISNCDCDLVVSVLKDVFGIVSLSIAEVVELDLEKVRDAVIGLLDGVKFKTFRASVNRPNKKFEMSSGDVEREVGGFVIDKFGSKVSLKEYDINVEVEISDKAYVFIDRVAGYGGLPLGIEGSYGLVSDKKSLLACWLVMKRGCDVEIVHLDSKVGLEGLNKFSYGSAFKIVDSMESVSKDSIVVVGQTLDEVKVMEDFVVLRPLVGFDLSEINNQIEELGL